MRFLSQPRPREAYHVSQETLALATRYRNLSTVQRLWYGAAHREYQQLTKMGYAKDMLDRRQRRVVARAEAYYAMQDAAVEVQDAARYNAAR